MSSDAQTPTAHRGPHRDGRQGPQGRRARLHVEPRHRGRLDGARVLACGDARLHRRDPRSRRESACRPDRLVRADPLRLARLPLPEQGRPRRRDDVRLDDARFRPVARLDERLGDLRRGRDRDGVAFGHRLAVHVPALRLDPRVDVGVLAHRRLGRLDRPDDLDLLPRHRALGRNAGLPAQRRDRHPRGLLDRRARQGLPRQRAARLDARERSWFNPFDLSFSSLILGVLLGIFIYWGWDSGVAVNEESRDSAEGPGKAAVLSTILLVLIYLVVSTAAIAFAGPNSSGSTRPTSSTRWARRSSARLGTSC